MSTIRPRTEDDWEPEDDLGACSGFLSAVIPQQRALPVAHCELSRICACWILRALISYPIFLPNFDVSLTAEILTKSIQLNGACPS